MKYKQNINIKINNFALGDANTKIKFYQSSYGPTNSPLKPDIKIYEELNSDRVNDFNELIETEVDCLTVDDYAYSNKIPSICLLKSDTQGFDLNVFKGASETLLKTKFIISELHFYPFYQNESLFFEICQFLYSKGFYLYSFYNLNKINYNMIIECDALFINSSFLPLKKIRE